MSFSITTTVSYNYLPLAEFCLPSWFKHSGADHIDVRYHPGSPSSCWHSWWFENLTFRCRVMQDAVREAVRQRRKLLLMDADCLVLKDLMHGFSDDKPFAVTKWRNINMGVMFLNTSLDWPFVDFYDEFAEKAAANCRAMIEQNQPGRAGDQDVMWEMLWAREDQVAQLDHYQWNFLCNPRTTQTDLPQYKDRIRILHLRFKSFGFDMQKIQYFRQEFPHAFENSP